MQIAADVRGVHACAQAGREDKAGLTWTWHGRKRRLVTIWKRFSTFSRLNRSRPRCCATTGCHVVWYGNCSDVRADHVRH